MPLPVPLLFGLREVADKYDAFLLDLWGVVWENGEVYDGVLDCLENLHRAGKDVVFLSNSPNRAHVIEPRLEAAGIRREWFKAAVTSGEVAYTLLHAGSLPPLQKGMRFYKLWQDSPHDPFNAPDAGVTPVADIHEADSLFGGLAGLDGTLPDFEDILAVGLSRSLPFLCVNPDRVVSIGGTCHMMAGRLAERYEQMGGEVIWIGKPYPAVYDAAMRLLGNPDRSRVAAIGDSLVTDISGAEGAGIAGIFNMTGIHWEELRMDHRPDTHDIGKVEKLLETHPHRPAALLCGFKW